MFEAGAGVLLESALTDLPSDLRRLFESGAVSIEQLAALHLGARRVADSVRKFSGGRFADSRNGCRRRSGHRARAARPALPDSPNSLGHATAIAEPLLTTLRSLPSIKWAEPIGSLRRGTDTVGDIEILAPAADPMKAFNTLPRTPTSPGVSTAVPAASTC